MAESPRDFGAVVECTVFLTPVPGDLTVQRAEAIMRVCRRLGVRSAVYRPGESPLSDRMASLFLQQHQVMSETHSRTDITAVSRGSSRLQAWREDA